jgi:outer membrane protein
MSTSLRAAFAALALAATASLPAAAQAPSPGPSTAPARIAYVNPQAVLENAPGRAEAQATLQREVTSAQEQMRRAGDSLNTAVQDYQKVQATLTAAQRETREKTLRTRNEEFQKRQQSLEEQLAQRQAALMNPIMEQVRKALEDIRTEDGYAMILSHEPGNSPILAVDKNLDITDRVVARLRSMGVPTAASAKPTGPASSPAGVTRPKTP